MSKEISFAPVWAPAVVEARGRLPLEKRAVRVNVNLHNAEHTQYRTQLNQELGMRGLSTCARSLHLSFFFDGTNNNNRYDTEHALPPQPSNIARLFHASLDVPENGYFSYYIPGVGTPFPEIGELDFSFGGLVGGLGGENRINWALLQIIDALSFAVDQKERLDTSAAMAKLTAMANRMLSTPRRGTTRRRSAIASLLEPLRGKAAKALPKVLKLKLYVYGFSRGAAEARTFVNWLSELLPTPEGATRPEQSLLGIPLSIEFFGLMDTVASVGVSYAAPFADGHLDWAEGSQQLPDEQRFPGWIKQCRHFVAAHEQRLSFPLESIRRPDGSYPSYAREVIYPGMHSDVGGGYPTGDQGKARATEGNLLSQIPLQDMYAAAFAGGAPLKVPKPVIPDDLRQNLPALEMEPTTLEEFDIHPELVTRFNAWRSTLGLPAADTAQAEPLPLGQSLEEALAEQMALITGWRIDRYNRGNYVNLPFYLQSRQTPKPQQIEEEGARLSAIAKINGQRNARGSSASAPNIPGLPDYAPVIDQQQLREAAAEFQFDYQGWNRYSTSHLGWLFDKVLRDTVYMLNEEDEEREYAQMKAAGERYAKVLFAPKWRNGPPLVSDSPVHAAVVALFDDHLHDSRAAFLHHAIGSREMWSGYLRYRTVFCGSHSNKRLTAVVVAGRINGLALTAQGQYRIGLYDWKTARRGDGPPPPGFQVIDLAVRKVVPFAPEALASLQPTHDIGPLVAQQRHAVLLAEEAQRDQATLAYLESVGSPASRQVPS